MVRIKKTYELGAGLRIMVVIDNNIALMSSNYGKEMLKLYWKMVKDKPDKKLMYNYRSNVIVEEFNIPQDEYIKNIDKDFNTALIEQKKASDKAREGLKKNENKS